MNVAPETQPASATPSNLYVRVLAVGALSALSMFFTKLALIAALLTFLTFLTLPRAGARWLWIALVLSALASAFGVLRFLVSEAIPGIVQGGTVATEQRALSRLRDIVFAEDAFRKRAFVDPDGDHIGSAGLLGELTGAIGLRHAAPLTPPVLEGYPTLVDTELGPAADVAGYLLIVCVPKRGGGFTAHPEDPIDDERAEREFFAYAWPRAPGRALDVAYAVDEHDRILRAPSVEGPSAQRLGVAHPPACDDPKANLTHADWRPWRGKQPRKSLPGDKP